MRSGSDTNYTSAPGPAYAKWCIPVIILGNSTELNPGEQPGAPLLMSFEKWPSLAMYGFAYDNMGRLIGTSTQYTFLPGYNFQNSYSYDMLNRLTTLTNFADRTLRLGRDVDGTTARSGSQVMSFGTV